MQSMQIKDYEIYVPQETQLFSEGGEELNWGCPQIVKSEGIEV